MSCVIRGRRVEVVELHLVDPSWRTRLRCRKSSIASGNRPWPAAGRTAAWSSPDSRSVSRSHLVYLCALMPAEGESAMELGSRHPGRLDTLVGIDEVGDLVLHGDRVDEILWADAPSEIAAMARTLLRPQEMQSSSKRLPGSPGGRHRPRSSSAVTTGCTTDSSSTRWHRGRRPSSSGIRATPRCCLVLTSWSIYYRLDARELGARDRSGDASRRGEFRA